MDRGARAAGRARRPRRRRRAPRGRARGRRRRLADRRLPRRRDDQLARGALAGRLDRARDGRRAARARRADPRRARARRMGGRPHPGFGLHALPRHHRAARRAGPRAPGGGDLRLRPARRRRRFARAALRRVVGAARGRRRRRDVGAQRLPDRALASRFMAVPRLRVPSASSGGSLRQAAGLSSDEVELYHRTYTTLLRSSGETLLRVLEPSHAAMNSSLHALAYDLETPDLGAFLYSLRRLPASIWRAAVIIVGQEAEAFTRAGIGRIEEWEPVEAPARRRRWYDSGSGVLAVLLASTSDLDDAIPAMVAYQLEWNKLHALLRSSELPEECEPLDLSEACGGSEEDWRRLRESWPGGLGAFVAEVRARRLNLRIRMLGGSQAGYARLTRRWWAPVRATLTDQSLVDRPMYFVSSNTHSMVNLVTQGAGASEQEIIDFIEANGPDYMIEELERFRSNRKTG